MIDDMLFVYVNDNGVSVHDVTDDVYAEEKYKELVKEYQDDPFVTTGIMIWWNDGWNAERIWSMDFEEELYAQTD
jgi:hypothetical protein